MTGPPEGKFVTSDDVVARFEGEFPSGRVAWAKWRIFDVENALMGLVPSLRKSLDEVNADSMRIGDPGRVDRVKALVADKVLALFRNPDGAASVAQSMEQDSTTRTYGFYRDDTRGRIAFTDAELDSVKIHKKRSQIGTMFAAPQW